jgi:hypothetical protein
MDRRGRHGCRLRTVPTVATSGTMTPRRACCEYSRLRRTRIPRIFTVGRAAPRSDPTADLACAGPYSCWRCHAQTRPMVRARRSWNDRLQAAGVWSRTSHQGVVCRAGRQSLKLFGLRGACGSDTPRLPIRGESHGGYTTFDRTHHPESRTSGGRSWIAAVTGCLCAGHDGVAAGRDVATAVSGGHACRQ